MCQSTLLPPVIDGPVLNGTTYYIANDGNDCLDGRSPKRAWKTLQHAVYALQPGDTALVAPGTYEGLFIRSVSFNGRANGWKAIRALDPGNKPRINTRSAHGSDGRPSGIFLRGTDDTSRIAYWFFDGLVAEDTHGAGFDCIWTDHIRIQNCEAYRNAINNPKNAGMPGPHYNHRCTGFFCAHGTNYVALNNHSEGNAEHGFYINNSSRNFIYRGNTARGNMGCGFHLNGDATMGGTGVCENGLYEYNMTDGNGITGGAAFNFDGLHNGIVRDNRIINTGCGAMTFFCMNGSDTSRHVDVHDNTIVVGGPRVTNHRYALNIVVDAPPEGNQYNDNTPNPHAGTPTHLHFHDNLIACGSQPVTLLEFQYATVEERHDITFVNNVICAANLEGDVVDGAIAPALKAKWLAQNRFDPNGMEGRV